MTISDAQGWVLVIAKPVLSLANLIITNKVQGYNNGAPYLHFT